MTIRHPEITVPLIGADGNAFSILGLTQKAMKKAGLDPAEIEEYFEEATSGDYHHLLATTMRWVEVE